MTKVQASLTIEIDVWEAAKSHFENVSATVEEILKSLLIDSKPDIKEAFDALKMKQQLEKDIKKLESEKKELEKKKKRKKENEGESFDSDEFDPGIR